MIVYGGRVGLDFGVRGRLGSLVLTCLFMLGNPRGLRIEHRTRRSDAIGYTYHIKNQFRVISTGTHVLNRHRGVMRLNNS